MKLRRKILFGIGIAMALAILIPVIHHYQLRFAVEKYISKLKAQGEPLELAQVIPPPMPSGENGALLVSNALSRLYTLAETSTNLAVDLTINNPPWEMDQTIPGKEMIGWNEPVIHDPNSNWPTNSWADLAEQLAERRAELDAFRMLPGKPRLDFNYDYSNPGRYVPEWAAHLSALKQAERWLESSEYYELHLGNTAAACADVRAMLAFVKGEADERLEICQLLRSAFANMAADATWDILQTTNVTDGDLAHLQTDWESLEFIAPINGAFQFEQVSSMELQNQLRHFHTDFFAYAQLPATSFVPKSKINGKWTDWNGSSTNFFLIDENSISKSQRPIFARIAGAIHKAWIFLVSWPAYYSYEDELRGLREWQIMFAATRMMETSASFLSVQSYVNTNYSRLGFDAAKKKNPYAIFSRNANQLAALRKAVMAKTARNVVITAIALKRYQLRYHRLPKILDELVPDFLKSVPTDCMDGQPLRYIPNPDGTFLLYSVGDNGKDDGGDPRWKKTDITPSYYDWQNEYALDWVWPQPATEAEVQKFYSDQKDKSE